MRKTVAAFLIALSGCAGGGDSAEPSEPSAPNHGFGFQFDAEGKEGLHLRQPGAMPRDAEFMEVIARNDVMACAGITAPPPPFVIVVPMDSLGDKRVGLYERNPPLIVLDESWAPIAYPHEVLHYLLDVTTGDPDAAHAHPGFSKCVISFPH